ncbi:MAG TPA: hypothetical protein VER32_14295 [Pyrinomonadaceae bacterium]|nr:hypothetical protein [Pyrinomonadaceae bacterium]
MEDWIGLGVIVFVLACGYFGMSYLGRPARRMSAEEFERRAAEGRGTTSAASAAGLQALEKLMNPKAAEAVEVQKDLRAGFYDDRQETGEGGGDGEGGEGARRSREPQADGQTNEEGRDA